MVRPVVFFEIGFNGASMGKVLFELFNDITPRTAENFRCLCTGEKGRSTKGKQLCYQGSVFHRIIPGFMCQGGDFTAGDGTGGESIYGHKFADENFKQKHKEPFLLSMANSGPNSNGSQFFITTKETPWLDGKHVVFGKVIEGQDLVKRMEACGSPSGKTAKKVTIISCGMADEKTSATDEPNKKARVDKVRVLHIIRKHKDSRRPSSWRQKEITCTKKESIAHLEELRRDLKACKNPVSLKETFTNLASKESDCGSAQRGGDLGTFGRGKMQKPFEEAAFALEIGELSNIVTTDSGVHLILRLE